MSTAGLYDNHVDRTQAQSGAVGGAIDLLTTDVRLTLIDDADYTANFATDVDYADVAAGAKVGEGTALLSKTFSGGVFDAADHTVSSVSGDGVESTMIREYDAVDANSELIALLDNGGTTTPNGNDINCVWDSGAAKIYSIT